MNFQNPKFGSKILHRLVRLETSPKLWDAGCHGPLCMWELHQSLDWFPTISLSRLVGTPGTLAGCFGWVWGEMNPYCWWFRNPAWKPVEVGSWNPVIYDGFYISKWWLFGISEPSTVVNVQVDFLKRDKFDQSCFNGSFSVEGYGDVGRRICGFHTGEQSRRSGKGKSWLNTFMSQPCIKFWCFCFPGCIPPMNSRVHIPPKKEVFWCQLQTD